MRAARIHDYDRDDGLSVDDIDVPSISPDQLLIRVAAASINPVDWKVRDGMLRAGIVLDLPAVLGGDVCGVVAAIGSEVRGFGKGDVVYAMTDTRSRYACGGFAEYVALSAANAAPKPSSLSAVEAAAVPLAALTAWQALHDEGQVQPGQRVLIHAAAGGVGGFAVQFAREAGAYVIGTASAANRDYVLRLGANEVIDYSAGPFEAEVRDIDLVIDLVGGDVQARSLSVIRPGGTLINAWGALAADEAAAAGVTARKVAVSPNGDQLRRIGALIDAGRVAVEVAHVLPLEEVEAALALSRRGHGRGKIILDVARIE
jgi:NADPH:quinone reductase-like Zn-dependent oxidoreductase